MGFFWPKDTKTDKNTLLVFIAVPVCLTCIKYFGDPGFMQRFLEGAGLTSLRNNLYDWIYAADGDADLRKNAYWILVLDFFYLLLPLLFLKLFWKEKISSFGLSLKFDKSALKIYLVFMLVMFPLVYFFSGTESFQSKYPFYHIDKGTPLWPKFWLWELLYFSQFFCLEFFFRGFMVHGLKNTLGIYSVFVMTIPYCMIHYGKPLPETFSAIIAGIVLGYLSYRNNSIFLGFFLHITVAMSMDLMSLWRQGFFG